MQDSEMLKSENNPDLASLPQPNHVMKSFLRYRKIDLALTMN